MVLNSYVFIPNSRIQIVYIDSLQCSACLSSKLIIWEEFLNNIKKLHPDFIICFIVSTDSQTEQDKLKKLLHLRSSELIMYADSDDLFVARNPIIKKSSVFTTFILDKNGQTMIFGNPIENDKVRELTYKTFKTM